MDELVEGTLAQAQNAGDGYPRSADLPAGLVGRSCGGYRITELLGEGGMGQVYLGLNEHLGKRAAIKVLLPSHSIRLRAESRFLQEARAAAQIDDPNIVDILDACEFADGRFYILMPFIEGCSLDELCDRMGPLPLEVAAEILLQICGGLDAAHRHGIVHRDVKPQNILIGPRQQRQHFVTIVDFGIAKLLDSELAVGVHTESKAMMGTPGYMAPEQARGSRDIDARVDVYAVGTVAYRMLTGRTPYLDETLYGLIEKQITNAPFPSPRQLRPNVPPLWEQAILAALAIDRDRRLSSVREFAELIARGIPKGDQLVRTLVPQLAGLALPPDALPVAGVLGPPPTAQLPSHAAPTVNQTGGGRRPAQPVSKARKGMSFALALATASVMGSVATYAAMGERREAAAVEEPGQRAEAANAAAETETEKAAAQRAEAEKAEAEKAEAARRAAPVPAPAPPPTASAAAPARPKASEARSGVVVVRVKRWANVFINDKNVGYAPVRKELAPGQHRVVLKNDETEETVKVTVLPGKTVTIVREL